MGHVPGTIYLLHYERLHKHAQQWARNLNSRLGEHEHGSGARLLQVARDAGIGWQLARTWPGDRYREGRLKEQGGRSASQAERAAGQVLEPGGQAQPEPPETGLDEPDRAAPARARLTAQWARTARPYLSAELEAGR